MVEKILQCPYCGSDNTKVSDFYGSWCGTCLDCEAKINDAVLLWNAASNALSKKDEEIARIADECDDLLGKLAFANAECDKLRAALNQTEDDRHETVGKLRLALIREANGYKRQDELEAEIARLIAACDDLEGEYLRMKDARDEARRVARHWYKTAQEYKKEFGSLPEDDDDVLIDFAKSKEYYIATYTRTEPQSIRVTATSDDDN